MISIIPKPKLESLKKGCFSFEKAIIKNNTNFPKTIKFFKEKFNISALNEEGNIKFVKVDDMNDEEYELNVDMDSIIIEASTDHGAFNAVISVLVSTVDNKCECMYIHDSPKYKYRSFMIDVARHFFDKEVIKRKIDEMARFKYNIFHFHVSDDQGFRLDIKKYPLLKKISTHRVGSRIEGMVKKNYVFDDEVVDGYYTEDDIKEIVEYASDRFIKVIPEIDVPGHTMAILAAYPEYHCSKSNIQVSSNWGISKDVMCIGNSETVPFVYDLLKEVIRIFNADEIHIGGDECPSDNYESCPKCQKKMKELRISNPKKLQGYFTEEVASLLINDGIKVIIWNEAIKRNMNKNITIQFWTDKNKNAVLRAIRHGYKAIVSPFWAYYCDYTYQWFNLKKTYTFDIEYKDYLDEKYRSNIIGIEAPLWTEWIKTEDKMNFQFYPRALAIAEAGWGTNDNYDDFVKRLEKNFEWFDKNGISYAPKEYFNKRMVSMLRKGIDVASCHEFMTETMYKKYKKN